MKEKLKKYLPWIILVLVIATLVTVFFLSRRVTQEELDIYQTKIEEAQTYLEGNQYSVAMSTYYEAVEIVPSKVEAYEGILSILLTKNKISEMQEIVQKSPRSLSGYDRSRLFKIVGDTYYNLGEYRKAYEMYDEGLAFGVENMSLELMLGKVMLKLGDDEGAKQQFSKTGYSEEEALETNLLLAYILSTEDTDSAKEKLSSLEPTGNMSAYYEELDGVLESLDEDTKFNATKLSRVYINNGYPYLAISVLEPLKEEIVEYLEGMYFLGRAYYETEQYEEAMQALDGALTLGGMESDILWIKARSYIEADDVDNVIKSYDSAITYAGKDMNLNMASEYIDFLLENDQVVKTIAVMRDVLGILEEDPDVYLLALRVYEASEDSEKIEYYLDLLDEMETTETQDIVTLQHKMALLTSKGEDIQSELDQLFALDQYNPHYHLYLAKTQLEQGDTESAIQSLERSIEYDLDYEVSQEALELLSSIQ